MKNIKYKVQKALEKYLMETPSLTTYNFVINDVAELMREAGVPEEFVVPGITLQVDFIIPDKGVIEMHVWYKLNPNSRKVKFVIK